MGIKPTDNTRRSIILNCSVGGTEGVEVVGWVVVVRVCVIVEVWVVEVGADVVMVTVGNTQPLTKIIIKTGKNPSSMAFLNLLR